MEVKRMPEESITRCIIDPELIYFHGKYDLEFKGICLKQNCVFSS